MKKIFQALTAATLLTSTSTFATPFDCNVDLNSVLIYGNGTVNVLHSGRGDYTNICNLKEERLGVSITTCAMWASMLLNLKNSNKKAAFYYDTATPNASCANLPTYSSSPAPVYIGASN